METTEEKIASVLHDILTQRELKVIMSNRGVGQYGRLRKDEMANCVAGVRSEEIRDRDRDRVRVYKQTKKNNELLTNEQVSTTQEN